MAVKILTMFFQVKATTCGLVGGCQRFLPSSCHPLRTLLSSGSHLESPHWSGSVSAPLVLIVPSLRFPLQAPYINCPSEPRVTTSGLKMEAARFSETLASSNQSTRWLTPKEHHQNHPTVISQATFKLYSQWYHTHRLLLQSLLCMSLKDFMCKLQLVLRTAKNVFINIIWFLKCVMGTCWCIL
jgi:hypothetical protein